MENMKQEKVGLSKKRTKLANIRTLLSFIRTSLILVSVAIAFFKLEKKIDWIFVIFLIFSAIFLFVGIFNYYLTKKQIEKM